MGRGAAEVFMRQVRREFRCLHRYRFPHSLGIFYEQVTSGLGFQPSRMKARLSGWLPMAARSCLLRTIESFCPQ